MTSPPSPLHWTQTAELGNAQRDCVTAIVLKILDTKCKMPDEQQQTMLAVYDSLPSYTTGLFDRQAHTCIAKARKGEPNDALLDAIHRLRLYAEANIEKTTMKSFKSRLRRELFRTAQ